QSDRNISSGSLAREFNRLILPNPVITIGNQIVTNHRASDQLHSGVLRGLRELHQACMVRSADDKSALGQIGSLLNPARKGYPATFEPCVQLWHCVSAIERMEQRVRQRVGIPEVLCALHYLGNRMIRWQHRECGSQVT